MMLTNQDFYGLTILDLEQQQTTVCYVKGVKE